MPDLTPERLDHIRRNAPYANSDVITLLAEVDRLRTENERLRKQLPEGMEHCTIQFKSCPVGHGRLTATNWVQHECYVCEINRLKTQLERDQSAYVLMQKGMESQAELMDDLKQRARKAETALALARDQAKSQSEMIGDLAERIAEREALCRKLVEVLQHARNYGSQGELYGGISVSYLMDSALARARAQGMLPEGGK